MKKLIYLVLTLALVSGCQTNESSKDEYSIFEEKSYVISSNENVAVIYNEEKDVMFVHYVPTDLYYYVVNAEGSDSMYEFKQNRTSIDQICSFEIGKTEGIDEACGKEQITKGKRIYANFLDKLDILEINSTDIIKTLDKIISTNYNTPGNNLGIRILEEFDYSKNSDEEIMKQIDNLESDGSEFSYGDTTILCNEEKEYIFAIRNDGYFLFADNSMLIDPENNFYITPDSKCFYNYKLEQVVDGYSCSNENIDNGKKSFLFMEEIISYLGYDLNSIKNTLLYAKDNKYSTNIEIKPVPTIYPSNSQKENNKDKQKESVTIGQKNAIESAYDYLNYSSFSYQGLIVQLEFEGYTTDESTYAADNCGADWKKQAEKKAQSYIDYSSFSRQGLIDQLIFEGFTKEEAKHGVSAVGY